MIHLFKEIKRKHGTLTLHFKRYKKFHSVQIYTALKENFRKTDYEKAINQGYLLNGVVKLTLSEYLWLLKWKDLILLWNNAFPITFNPTAMIPYTPPALDKKKFTLKEKKIIESKGTVWK